MTKVSDEFFFFMGHSGGELRSILFNQIPMKQSSSKFHHEMFWEKVFPWCIPKLGHPSVS